MKNLKLKAILSTAAAMVMLYGCTKSGLKPGSANTSATGSVSSLPMTHDGLHVYGLLPTPVSEYEGMPKYDAAAFKAQYGVNSVTAGSTTVTLATPAVRDQGQIGSCTAFCGSEAYEITYNYTHGSFPPLVSPAFLYYEERVNILHDPISSDDGANMVNIGQALEKYGITSDALMPYPSSDKSTAYKTAPTAAAISYALGYEAKTNTLIATGDTAAVKACLRANIPVMMGLNVYDNTRTYQYFENLNTTSYTYNPLTSTGALEKGVSLLGGHATPIVGYNDSMQAFLVQNSWGTDWGLNGFYYMPYSVFMSTKIVPAGSVYYLAVN